jgi:ABC-type lipoprotein export system ATPase subunit
MADPAIRATGVVKWFGEGDARTQALRGVNVEAFFGEMLYIVGPSGSGKTTLLSVLSGILRPDSGNVSVEGAEIWKLGSDKLADFRLHKIGFVFQDFHLRIPAKPITHSELMAITVPSDADHRRSEATLGCSYHAEVIGIRQSLCA